MGANVIRVGIDQLPAALQRGEERFARALSRGLRLGAERGRALMVKKTPADLGQLRASWKVKAADLVAELINDAPHAGIIEMGARPHKVSPEGWAAIYEWVRRHPELYNETRARSGVGRDAHGRYTAGRRAELDPQISAITWGIVKKLNREGQKPTYFVMKNLDALKAVMIAEVERQLAHVTANAKGQR